MEEKGKVGAKEELEREDDNVLERLLTPAVSLPTVATSGVRRIHHSS
jgi:hypothetical protein